MRRIMSFLDEKTGKELVLPVTPSGYTWAHPNRVESIQLDQTGEINLPGGAMMGSCTLDNVLLPTRLYSFCNPGAVANPYVYLEQLEIWSDNGTVVRWMVSGTPVNAPVIIESIDQGERDGTNDLYITIRMKQYRKPEVPVLAVSGGGAQTSRDDGTGAAQERTYTIQSGDTLWGIANTTGAGPSTNGWQRPTATRSQTQISYIQGRLSSFRQETICHRLGQTVQA